MGDTPSLGYSSYESLVGYSVATETTCKFSLRCIAKDLNGLKGLT